MNSSIILAAKHTSHSMAGYLLGVWLIFGILFMASLPASAKGAMARADVLENCNWNRPGVDPFMGDVVAAVDRYTDIAPQIREQLKERMRARQYDEIVLIKRDSISGKQLYNPRISEMHFGPGRVCRNVTRAGWSDQMQERGLVYCVQGECILVPTVCRNVSRITRAQTAAPGAAAAGAAPGAAAPEAGLPAAAAPVGGAPADALHSGSFAEAALVPVGGYAFTSDNFVGGPGNGPANFSAPPSAGAGGGGGGGGAISPGTGNSSFIEIHPLPPITILPTMPTLPTSPSVLPAVPEPQTWAMLLAGLALLGYCARRRKPS